MIKRENIPVVMTVGGSDSGGGAGIQADLKTFAAFGVHGTSAITCLTAQNPKHVLAIQPARADIVEKQIQAVFEAFQPRAVKTGMLYSAEIIRVVGKFFRAQKVPLIVDPVMVATSGALLLKPSAVKALREQLLLLATLVTPNLDEAEILVGRKISSHPALQLAARDIFKRFGCAVLVKGGHLPGAEAIDFFCDGKTELALCAKFIPNVSTHGTGCTYSAAIAAQIALGHKLPEAVRRAKKFVTRAIRESLKASDHFILRNF